MSESPSQPESAPAGPGSEPAVPADAMAEQALQRAQDAVSGLSQGLEGAAASGGEPTPVDLPSFEGAGLPASVKGIDLLTDVNLNVKIELGRTKMLIEDVLRLGEGAVVELDKLAGDPVDIYVNERHIARGEVLVLNDNFCVRINEVIRSPGEGAADAAGKSAA